MLCADAWTSPPPSFRPASASPSQTSSPLVLAWTCSGLVSLPSLCLRSQSLSKVPPPGLSVLSIQSIIHLVSVSLSLCLLLFVGLSMPLASVFPSCYPGSPPHPMLLCCLHLHLVYSPLCLSLSLAVQSLSLVFLLDFSLGLRQLPLSKPESLPWCSPLLHPALPPGLPQTMIRG